MTTYSIGGGLRVVGCNGENHPLACTARVADQGGEGGTYTNALLYQWDLRMDSSARGSYHDLSDAEKEAMGDFLEEHGVQEPAKRFMDGSSVKVIVRCDGVLMVHTWRVVLDDAGNYLRCEACPHCVKQERVVVPLVTPVPVVGTAYVDPDVESWLPMRRFRNRHAGVPQVRFTAPITVDVDALAAIAERRNVLARMGRPV